MHLRSKGPLELQTGPGEDTPSASASPSPPESESPEATTPPSPQEPPSPSPAPEPARASKSPSSTPSDGRCPIVTLPSELLAHISDLFLEGLSALQRQTSTIILIKTCRTFYHTLRMPHQLVITTPQNAVKLALQIRKGTLAPKSLCLMLDESNQGKSGMYGTLLRANCANVVELELCPGRRTLVGGDSFGEPLCAALPLLVNLESFITTGAGGISSNDLAQVLTSWPKLTCLRIPELRTHGLLYNTATVNRLPTSLRNLDMPSQYPGAISIIRRILFSPGQTLHPHMSTLESLKVNLAVFQGTPSPIFDVLSSLPTLRHLSVLLESNMKLPFSSDALSEFFTAAKSLNTFEIVEPMFWTGRFEKLWIESEMSGVQDTARAAGVVLTFT